MNKPRLRYHPNISATDDPKPKPSLPAANPQKPGSMAGKIVIHPGFKQLPPDIAGASGVTNAPPRPQS